MKIGDKRVICYNNKNRFNCDLPNKSDFDYVSLKIIENKTGIGEFSGEPVNGFLAEGSDYYLYGYNYPVASEGFFSGSTWTRYMPIKYKNKKFEELSDQEKDKLISKFIWRDISIIEFEDEPVKLLEKYDFIDYCEKHNLIYYKPNCWRCKAESRLQRK